MTTDPAPAKKSAPPAGVPPLIVVDPREQSAALGGPPMPMRVGRPDAAPATPAAPARKLPPTFAGPDDATQTVRRTVADIRPRLAMAVAAITQLEESLPGLIDQLRPHAAQALASEQFDISAAEGFLADLTAALDKLSHPR